jgi:non-specific protein-tyrosine kinase
MFTRYLNLVRRWLWLLVATPALAAGAAFGYSQLTTPVYEASLTLWVSQASSGPGQQYADILASERLAKTYGALITKRPVLQATIDRLALPMTADELSREIAVKMVRDTQLLEVTARHNNPQLAATIVNTLAQTFEEQNLEIQKEGFSAAAGKLNAEISKLDTQLRSERSRLEKLNNEPLPDEAELLEIERLTSSIAQHQVSYASVLKSLEEVRLSEATSINNVSVAEEASVPHEPVAPRTALNLIFGVVFGVLVATGLVALLEYLDDSFRTAGDLQASLSVTIMGNVHMFGSKGQRSGRNEKQRRPVGPEPLVALSDANSHFAEAYRLLRTNLEFAALDKPLRTLQVTSALPQEGKSTTAANLAVVMAQSGKRVLLVDLDLRRPTLHRYFKVPNLAGLTSVLLGVTTVEAAIQQVGIENLRVLSSGPLPPSPADTLSSLAAETLLATLAERFDIVIVDSPPVMVASDAVVIASRMDGVLVVVAAGKTSRRATKQAVEGLQRSSSSVLGAVFNMQRAAQGSEAYMYYELEEDRGRNQKSESRRQLSLPDF